jgi:hypothetical protein
MLLTWFIDVDMAVHHTRHEDQVPHILHPKARSLMKQLLFRRYASSRRCASSRVPGHGKKSEVSAVLEGGRNRRQSCITSEDRLYV